MAGITNLPRKLSDAVHVEKAPVSDELVEYMNNLIPPVTPEEEKKVARKIDLRLPPFLFILYVFTWLDRGALGMAVLGVNRIMGPTDMHRQCCAHEYSRGAWIQ